MPAPDGPTREIGVRLALSFDRQRGQGTAGCKGSGKETMKGDETSELGLIETRNVGLGSAELRLRLVKKPAQCHDVSENKDS